MNKPTKFYFDKGSFSLWENGVCENDEDVTKCMKIRRLLSDFEDLMVRGEDPLPIQLYISAQRLISEFGPDYDVSSFFVGLEENS